MLSATVDYSSVLAGAKILQENIRFGTKLAFESLTLEGTHRAVEYLQESYKTKPGRPDFARTGTLERAVFTAVNLGTVIPGGFLAGIGDMKQLYAQAPYWDMVEEGSTEYVGEEVSGFWADSSGQPWGLGSYPFPGSPKASRYPKDRFIGAQAVDMIIKTPIQAHNFYRNTSKDMDKRFMIVVSKYILGAIR
jgi:hypothetical protein